MSAVPNSAYWEERLKPNGRSLYVCLPCQDNRERQIHHLKDHEKSAKHLEALADFEEELSNKASSASHLPVIGNQVDALGLLLASATENPSQHEDYPLFPPSPPDNSHSWPGPHSPVTGINWNLLEATENTTLENSPLHEYIQSLSQASLDFINGDLSEDELLERISLGSDSSHAPQAVSDNEDNIILLTPLSWSDYMFFSGLGMLLLGLYLLLTWARGSKYSQQFFRHKIKSLKLCHHFLILAWVSTSNPCSRILRLVSKTHSSLLLNKLNIRRVAQEMICQPMRTAFKKMHIDIEVKMRRHPDKHQLGNIIGTPSRETLFTAKVKAISSQVRNTFRLDLWKSLSPGRSVPLSKFTVQQNLKNRPGALIGQENEQGYIIHYALLRRFALDNPDLKPTLSELSSQDSEREGNSDVDGDEESLEPGRKRRRNAQDVSSQAQGKGGRVPNGKDFWSKVDNWFKDEIKKRGNDLTGARWKLYIDETLKQDNARFDSSVFSGPANTPSSVVPSLPHSSEPLGSIVSSHSDAAGLTVRSDVFGHRNNLVEGIPSQSTSSTRDDGISAPQPSSSSLASLLRSAGV